MSEKSTFDVLVAARALISDERNWCQGALAKARNGAGLSSVYDPTAFSFCALGAVIRAVDDSGIDWRQPVQVLHAAASPFGECITSLNNSGTHADVLAMFDRAIESERAVRAIIDDALTAAADPVQRERVLQHGSV